MSTAKAFRGPPKEAYRRVAASSDATGRTGARRRDRAVGIPRLLLTPDRVRDLPIDPRVAFLLSRIDGQSGLETLVDVTGFPVDEVIAILGRLVRLRAIDMAPASVG